MVRAFKPADLTEALRLRKETACVPLAGGTDLMVKYRNWTGLPPAFPGDVLFLSHLKELQTLERRGETLRIGAGVPLADIAAWPETPAVLREAVRGIAAPAIRNVATLAGNVCNASPAGDGICALYALDARLELTSVDGTREVSILAFITGPGRTVLRRDELVTAVLVPRRAANIQVFRKVGTRKANALAKLSFAAVGEVKEGIVDAMALSFGAVGPTVVRSTETEKRMAGKTLAEVTALAPSIVEDYAALIVPIDDQRSTAAYRKTVALNLLKSFLEGLKEKVKGI